MPIEIRQVTIKAIVENPKQSPTSPQNEQLALDTVNLELLIDDLQRKTKNKNER